MESYKCQCGCGKKTKLSQSKYLAGHNPKKGIKHNYLNGNKGWFHKNKKDFKKGKTYEEVYGEETARIIKAKLRISHKGQTATSEIIKKRLRRNPKSSLETKFEDIINQFNLPYKFVGDGKFFIERKNPDFININGEKIAIEVYYRKHKEKFAGGLENWKMNRQKIFNDYGWKIMFFDETQVKEDLILKTLTE